MRTLIQITRGVIRDTGVRRWMMFGVVLAALVMLFAGSTFLMPFLAGRPILFLFYWVVCAWLTLLAMMLALYDLLAVRLQVRRERKRLRTDIFGDDEK